MKKIIIVGAGIAGLSAGVYALKCGFDVTILESHRIAGGNCTSWKRGDYTFEGGMHWLGGSNEKEPLNKSWRYIGAIDDSVRFSYSEPFLVYDYRGTPINLYRDVEKTERHLLDLSPDDAKEIKTFCNNIRKIKNLSMPLTDLRGVKVTKKHSPPLSLLFSSISAARIIKKYAGMSRERYANTFAHEGIREMFKAFPGDAQGVPMLFMTFGSLARGDGGYPEGGSLPFVERIVRTFTSLGGEILYKTHVDQVIVKNGRAVGVKTSDNEYNADAVIVASDTMSVGNLFETLPKATWLEEMRESTGPTMVILVSLGINADLSKYPSSCLVTLKNPILFAGQEYKSFIISNYADNRAYSPSGKTAVTIQLPGDTYDFWKKAKAENRYKEEKEKIAEQVISAITEQIPETDGYVEVCDIATPLTYERYCDNWKGSWMTEIRPDMKMKTYPSVIQGLDDVYFAGQRMMPPGGLPPALMSGRNAVQYICRDTKTLFISEE